MVILPYLVKSDDWIEFLAMKKSWWKTQKPYFLLQYWKFVRWNGASGKIQSGDATGRARLIDPNIGVRLVSDTRNLPCDHDPQPIFRGDLNPMHTVPEAHDAFRSANTVRHIVPHSIPKKLGSLHSRPSDLFFSISSSSEFRLLNYESFRTGLILNC